MIARVNVVEETDDRKLYEIIDEVVLEYGRTRILSVDEKRRIKNELFHSIRGLDILEEILEDYDVTEIMINGPEDIFVEKNGEIVRLSAKFCSRERLDDLIQKMVAGVNRRVNEASPIVDSRLSDGSRVNVVLRPIALNGPVVTIRKFPKTRITMEKLIGMGSITKEAADFLKMLVVAGYNIFISGGTGSGKTTFLNALSNYIPDDERIITIEDSAELQLQNIKNIVRLEARQANLEGENAVTIRDLIRTSLRMRPDRIVVGEVRGAEALDMLQAMNTGHDGSLSTGHANSPTDMLSRLETMVLMGMELPLPAVRGQIASGLDVIVHLGRLRDGTRKVLEIVEILSYEEGKIETNCLFCFEEETEDDKKGRSEEYDQDGGSDGKKVIGRLQKKGEGLKNQMKLHHSGMRLCGWQEDCCREVGDPGG